MKTVTAKEYVLWQLNSLLINPTEGTGPSEIIELLKVVNLFEEETIFPSLQYNEEGIFLQWKAGTDFIIVYINEWDFAVSSRIDSEETYFEHSTNEDYERTAGILREFTKKVQFLAPNWREVFNTTHWT